MDRRRFLMLAAAGATAASMPRVLFAATQAATADPFAKMDGVALAQLIRKGDATPVDVLEAIIRRIEALNPKLNAVVTDSFLIARDRAKRGDFKGPFAGVPILIKDLDNVKGVRTTSGCRLLMTNLAEETDIYPQACIDAGFNVTGKTNTPEFGLEATTESLALGPCYNPWNLTRSSGGSSGGAGAAVAARIVPIAHGSDGGGSIRIPASCCGVFGLKPSRGRLMGSSAEFNLSVDGGLTISVRDTAHFLAATERTDADAPLERLGIVEGPAKRRLKIGVMVKGMQGEEPDGDVVEATHRAAMLCKELGHEVEELKLVVDGPKMVEAFITLWSSMAFEAVSRFENMLGRKMTVQDLEPLTLAFAEISRKGGRESIGAAVQTLQATAVEFQNQIDRYDVVLTPVLRSAPPVIGEQAPSVPYEILIERMAAYVAYTPIYNVTGQPAMSVPLFWNKDGMPIGTQLAAKLGGERTLLELAYELEQARPWANQVPPVAVAGQAS